MDRKKSSVILLQTIYFCSNFSLKQCLDSNPEPHKLATTSRLGLMLKLQLYSNQVFSWSECLNWFSYFNKTLL